MREMTAWEAAMNELCATIDKCIDLRSDLTNDAKAAALLIAALSFMRVHLIDEEKAWLAAKNAMPVLAEPRFKQ